MKKKTDFKKNCKLIWETREHYCELCSRFLDSPRADYFHHRKKKSQGGGHEIENLQLLCRRCHAEQHGITIRGEIF